MGLIGRSIRGGSDGGSCLGFTRGALGYFESKERQDRVKQDPEALAKVAAVRTSDVVHKTTHLFVSVELGRRKGIVIIW